MSFPVWNSDGSWNKITSSYFKDTIDLSGNFIIRNGTIKSPANTIEFDDSSSNSINFTNIKVTGNQKLTYNSVIYDVGQTLEKIAPLETKLTNVSYTSGTTTTSIANNTSLTNVDFSGNINTFTKAQFDNGINFSKSATSDLQTQITNINAISLSANNTFTGSNIFNETLRLNNNLRLQGALLVANGGTTITNATLVKVNFLSNVTSDVNDSISALNTKTTNISFAGVTTSFGGQLSFPTNSINSTAIINNNFVALTGNQAVGGQKTFNSQLSMNNNIRMDTGSLILNSATLTLTNANLQKIQYISDVSSAVGANLTSLQTQINNFTGVSLSASNVFTGTTNQFSNNIRLDGSLIVNNNGTTLTNDNLNRIQYLSNVSSDVNTSITNLNSSVSTLNTKTTKMSYMSVGGINTTTILDGLISQTFSFSNTINNINTTTFGYISGLTSSAQTQISNLASKLTDVSYSGTTTTISNTLATSTLTFSSTLNNISTTTFGYLSGLTENIKTSLDNLSARISTVEIVGTIIMSPLNDLQTTTSNKYLMCNGQTVSRSTYSALFAKFGTLFGVGDNSTTFSLPCYNGMFFRGMGTQIINGTTYGNYNSTYEPDQDSIQNHTHSGQSGSFLGTVNIQVSPSYRTGTGDSPNAYTFSNTGQMATGRINDFETKPVSIGIYYYVRT